MLRRIVLCSAPFRAGGSWILCPPASGRWASTVSVGAQNTGLRAPKPQSSVPGTTGMKSQRCKQMAPLPRVRGTGGSKMSGRFGPKPKPQQQQPKKKPQKFRDAVAAGFRQQGQGLSADPVGRDEPLKAVVESEDAWKSVVDHVSVERVALVRGTAQSGKTSFFARGVYYSKQPGSCLSGYDVHQVEFGQADKVFEQFCIEGQDFSKTILLFDEAYSWFAAMLHSPQDHLLTYLLKKAGPKGCRVVFATTSALGDHKLQGTTPKELEGNQFWFSSPSLNPVAVSAYVKSKLPESFGHAANEALSQCLFNFCGNHIGLLSLLLLELHKQPQLTSLSTRLLFGARVLGGGNGAYDPAQERIMAEICANGVVDARSYADVSESLKVLIRKGQLAPVQLLKRGASTCCGISKFRPDDSLFTFTHSFQADRCRYVLAPPVVKVTHPPKSAFECFLFALPRMPAVSFLFSATPGSSAGLQEAQLQHGFGYALTTSGLSFCPEFPIRAGAQGRPPSIDFVVYPGNRGIEFLCDALIKSNSMQAHVERFISGAYSEFKDYVVVSFQLTRGTAELPDHCCIVTPHAEFGWNVCNVNYKMPSSTEAHLFVHRNGVPHTIDQKPAQEWVPPLPSSVWVQYEIHVFEVTPSKNNVDALKDAVKTKAQMSHPSFQLFVKDSKGNVLKGSAPLATNTEETAYVVIAPTVPQEATASVSVSLVVWVQYGTAVFKVTPATNDIDALKDAVKTKAQMSHPSFQLIVKDSRGNVLEVDAPLVVNTKETAYIVE